MKTFVHIGSLAFVWLLAIGCKSKSDASGQPQQEPEIQIRVAEASEQVAQFPVRVTGVVISRNEAKPSFKVGGVIKRTFANEGDVVMKGQLLATLNMTEINAQVTQAGEAVEKARRDVQRVKNLFADSVATLEQTQNAQTALRMAEETKAIALFNQQFAEVRAPITGKVVKKFMQEGEVAGPGMPVFYIVGNVASDWRIKAGVSDRDWARLAEGDRADIGFDAFPGQTFQGAITEIAQTVNPSSGTFDVEVLLQGKPPRMAAGLVASMTMYPKASGTSIFIPVDALIQGNDEQGVVFVIGEDMRARKTSVRIQAITGEGVILKSGLKAGEKVATVGGAFLENGAKVSIIE